MILYRTMKLRYNETTSVLFIIQRTIFEIRIPTPGRVRVELRYLPPANEDCKGYVFTGVCLSKGGVCLCSRGCLQHPALDRHTPEQTLPIDKHTPLGRHLPGQTPPGQTAPCPVHAGIHIPLLSACWDTHLPHPHPHPRRYYGIRSTSRRYASHWSAFLFWIEPSKYKHYCNEIFILSIYLFIISELRMTCQYLEDISEIA